MSFRAPGERTKKAARRLLSNGGLEEIRTPDPHNANVVRSQLRYKPVFTYPDIIACFWVKVKQNLCGGKKILTDARMPSHRTGRAWVESLDALQRFGHVDLIQTEIEQEIHRQGGE